MWSATLAESRTTSPSPSPGPALTVTLPWMGSSRRFRKPTGLPTETVSLPPPVLMLTGVFDEVPVTRTVSSALPVLRVTPSIVVS